MSDADSLYVTLPLKPPTIRLLEVQPAIDPSDSINCELRAWVLESAPSYKALSYAWKEHQGAERVDGHQDVQREGRLEIANVYPSKSSSSVAVSPSLTLAIRRQRRKTRSVFLWIDAVCIDQEDNVERTDQVALMGTYISRHLRSSSGSVNAHMKMNSGNGCRADILERFSTLTGACLRQEEIMSVATSESTAP